MQFIRVKISVHCPIDAAERLRLAIGDAGFGQIGNYSHCCFVSNGTGYFKPNQDANPHIGEAGQIESVEEVAIEFICNKEDVARAKQVITDNHPYEEVALDVFPLLDV